MGFPNLHKMEFMSARKLILLFSLVILFIAVYNGVEGRGGRGGGRGGSRGGSRGSRGSRGSSSSGGSSRVRAAISSYKGPRYSKGSWKTYAAAGAGAGALWGMSSYKRRSRYRSHPDREPQICFNAVNPKNGTYGYFICPEAGQPDSYDYCCGEEGDQRCCGFFDDGGRVAGVVIGVIAFCAIVVVGIFCLCKHCRGRSKSSGGKVLDDNNQATWNKRNDSVNVPPGNTYPSTTEYPVQPTPYTTNPAQPGFAPPQDGFAPQSGYPPTQDGFAPQSGYPRPQGGFAPVGVPPYPAQPYGAPYNTTDGYDKLPPGEMPYSSDPYAAGPGVGFTYNDPSAPPQGPQGYTPTTGQPYPPAPPPPYPQS